MWLWILLAVACVLLALRFTYHFQAGKCTSKARLTGKTVIITGASAGIGKVAAHDLAGRGARVIMACRNQQKAQEVADSIIHSTGNTQVVVRELELSSLASVRRFAKEILTTESALHILINNAGIAGGGNKLTSDNLELTMATNHFGHFLLTNLLLGLMKGSAPGRVINVSSLAHKMAEHFDVDDLNFQKSKYPKGLIPYAHSKLANVLFTNELASKLRGTDITANCLHPGVVYTEILQKSKSRSLYSTMIRLMMVFVGKDENLGAQTIIHLAVSEEVEKITGEYFVDCKIDKRSETGQDQVLSKKLWDVSERLVKLSSQERHF